MLKKILFAGLVVVGFGIGMVKGFIGGVQKSFDTLKDEHNLTDLTVKLPVGKNTTITVCNKDKKVENTRIETNEVENND